MNAMPSKLHSGSIFVCMCVCQSILHAKLVRFFRLLDGWHSFVRSVDALGGDQKRKAANTHPRTHEASFLPSSLFHSFFILFFPPDFEKISSMHSRTSWWVFTGEGNIIIECAHNNKEMYTRLCSCYQSPAQQQLPERGSGRAEEWF